VNVLHVPFGYYPDPVGGTEVYVAELAKTLRRLGVESAVAAPALGDGARVYEHDGTTVYRFGVGPITTVADLYGEGDPGSAAAIDRALVETRADVLHLHAFTTAASLRAVRAAHRRGVAVAFTYHTPTASCVRGTLLRDGVAPCDGELLEQRCASCLLESRGAAEPVRAVLSRVPPTLGTVAGAAGLSGRWITALRARELTRARHSAFRQLLRESDAVIAVCEWVRSLLLRAGAEPSRLMLSRQGTNPRPRPEPPASPHVAGTLRLVFIGRLHPTKGVDVVIRALRSKPALRATLDIYGVAQGDEALEYRSELLRLAATDLRIRFRDAVRADDIVPTLAQYDATVVPSQWLETGPLTVLESFAAGIPVLGSDLGGIAELVRHDHDGCLVPYADAEAWAAAVERFATDPSLVRRLAARVPRPRSTHDVGRDMVSVYEAIAPTRHRQARELPGTVRHAGSEPVGAT